MKLPTVDTMALFLLIIGGLNAGIDAVADYNVIGQLVDAGSAANTVVYALVGLSALYVLADRMGWMPHAE
jgi:uncharacterized membrane protein YuzA (DUF378 family)